MHAGGSSNHHQFLHELANTSMDVNYGQKSFTQPKLLNHAVTSTCGMTEPHPDTGCGTNEVAQKEGVTTEAFFKIKLLLFWIL